MKTPEKITKLCVVSSYEFVDTNATKARLGVFIDVLSAHFDVSFIVPTGSAEVGAAKLVNVGEAPARGGFFVRAIREFQYSFKVWRKLRQLRPAVLLVSCPSIFLLLLTYYKRCPTILDIRDLTWEYLPSSNFFSRAVKALFRKIARNAIRNADMVFVTNEVEYNYINEVIGFLRVHIPVHIVRNGISSSRFKFIREIPDNRDPTHPVLLYVGNVGIAQNLTTIVEIADQFPDLRIFIIGEGRDLDRVKSYSEARLVDNITFVGGVPWVDLMDYYSRANVLYAQIADAYASAIPSKLYEYLTVGVPVIYGGQGVAADFLAEFECVKVVESENPKSLSAAIQNILTDISISRNKINPVLISKKYIREVQVSNVVLPILGLCENAKKTV